MKKITLALIMAVVLLLVGCTVTIKPEQNNLTDLPEPDNTSTRDQTGNTPIIKPNTESFEEEIKNMDNEKIECADSFITDVYSKKTVNDENKLEKAEYRIIQGKDGTKYSAELRYEDNSYYFTLDDESGKNLLSLNTFASYYGDVFEILDLNMDGLADIQFLVAEGIKNNEYIFFVWNDEVQNFLQVECDDQLIFTELKVCDGYLQLWGRNDASSGVIEKYTWDKNKLVKMSEEEYHADEESSGKDIAWRFTSDDIKLKGKTILGITHEQLLKTFGEPVETKKFQVNPPATEPDTFEYLYVCVYDQFECGFYSGENNNGPAKTDTVRTFDLTGPYVQLDCELNADISKDDLDLRYSINRFYDLNEAEDSYDVNNIRTILKNYKPEGYYYEYDKAAIVYCDPESFDDPLAKALVLLSNGNYERVQRIVFGYPTAN